MTDLPDPLIPSYVDLRTFDYMPLYVNNLADSDFATQASPEAFRAGVILWGKSWHQVPAGSLPNDDKILAKLAGYGWQVDAWLAIKDEALHGFLLCADDRYYHPFICKQALRSWDAHCQRENQLAKDRERKRLKKLVEAGMITPEEMRRELAAFENNPPEDQSDSTGTEPVVNSENEKPPPENQNNSGGSSDGVPSENALKGKERKGKEVVIGGGDARAREPGSVTGNRGHPIQRVVDHFLDERERLWPNHPNWPSDENTLSTQAKGFLDIGGTPEVINAALTKGMDATHARGKNPPNSLKAYTPSIQDKIIDFKNGGQIGDERSTGNRAHRGSGGSKYDDALAGLADAISGRR